MNTIPLTLDSYRPTYTVIGGSRIAQSTEHHPVSILLINRGPRPYRSAAITELLKAGFHSIVSIETGADTPELEAIASRTPALRYICMHEEHNPGICINIGIRESLAPYVLVLWNDMRLASSALSSRFFERVLELDHACLAPMFFDSDGAVVPSVTHPAQSGKAFRVVQLNPLKDGEKSLFPFDYSGIYSREKFIMLGGYDWTLQNPYWQKLDFGLRCWLWGETISHVQALKIKFEGSLAVEDHSYDEDYDKFWLKNLAPVYRGDSAYIPLSKFFGYMWSSKKHLSASVMDFSAARNWVKACSYRFKADASCLAGLWDPMP